MGDELEEPTWLDEAAEVRKLVGMGEGLAARSKQTWG